MAALSQAVQRNEAHEHGQHPRDEEQPAEEPGVDSELGVGRLAGLDRDVGAGGGRAGVARPVSLRVAEDGLDPVDAGS